MLDQLFYLFGVGAITWYVLRAVFSVLGFVFRLTSPPIERLDLWLKSKARQRSSIPARSATPEADYLKILQRDLDWLRMPAGPPVDYTRRRLP